MQEIAKCPGTSNVIHFETNLTLDTGTLALMKALSSQYIHPPLSRSIEKCFNLDTEFVMFLNGTY